RERKKSLLTTDVSTADTATADAEDVIKRVKLSKLTDTAEFNLIFLAVTEAAVTSYRHFFSTNNTVRKTLLLSYK
ncbi:hypothetical protein EMPG_10884, partial [Blastomyces silverae]